MLNRGKQYEAQVKRNWYRAFPKGFIYRIPDQMSGYKYTSSNISDFIGYQSGYLYLMECKSHQGNTFPFSCLTQYSTLAAHLGMPGVRVGVFLWMIDHDVEIYLPIETIKAMKKDELKSFNIKYLKDSPYRFFVFPSKKKRVFLESDYSLLNKLQDGD